MARPRVPVDKRVFLLILAAGGSATRAQICRSSGRNLSAAQITEGLTKCGDLLEGIDSHFKDSRRSCRRYSLTVKGLAAAQYLKPDWQPRRLATSVLQAWFEELRIEQDQWACGLLRAAEKMAEFNEKKAAGWRWVPPIKHRRKVKHVVIPDRLRSPASVAPPAVGSGPGWRSDLSSPPSSQRPLSDYEKYLREQYPTPHAPVAVSRPAPSRNIPTADNERIKARIRKMGYGDAIDGEKVWFDNRPISFKEWEKENPE